MTIKRTKKEIYDEFFSKFSTDINVYLLESFKDFYGEENEKTIEEKLLKAEYVFQDKPEKICEKILFSRFREILTKNFPNVELGSYLDNAILHILASTGICKGIYTDKDNIKAAFSYALGYIPNDKKTKKSFLQDIKKLSGIIKNDPVLKEVGSMYSAILLAEPEDEQERENFKNESEENHKGAVKEIADILKEKTGIDVVSEFESKGLKFDETIKNYILLEQVEFEDIIENLKTKLQEKKIDAKIISALDDVEIQKQIETIKKSSNSALFASCRKHPMGSYQAYNINRLFELGYTEDQIIESGVYREIFLGPEHRTIAFHELTSKINYISSKGLSQEVIVHEATHAISDLGTDIGFAKSKEKTGEYFNEAVTEYLTIRQEKTKNAGYIPKEQNHRCGYDDMIALIKDFLKSWEKDLKEVYMSSDEDRVEKFATKVDKKSGKEGNFSKLVDLIDKFYRANLESTSSIPTSYFASLVSGKTEQNSEMIEKIEGTKENSEVIHLAKEIRELVKSMTNEMTPEAEISY